MKLLKSLAISGVLLLAFGSVLTSCEKDDDHPWRGTSTISEIIASDTTLSILNEAITKAGFVSTFNSTSNDYTLFAPNNTAFRALFKTLGVTGISDLTAEQLKPILLYHVLGTKVFYTSFRTGYRTTLSTYENNASYPLSLYIDLRGSSVKINNIADIVVADEAAKNGCVHVINTVLLPPTAVGIAINNPNFSTLVAAVVKAGLANALAASGPFTLFAPTNTAFANYFTTIGVSGVEALDATAISNLLKYHAVSGFYPASLLTTGNLTTLNGSTISVVVSSSSVTINGTATVTIPNLFTTNGVVHAINAVLVPPAS